MYLLTFMVLLCATILGAYICYAFHQSIVFEKDCKALRSIWRTNRLSNRDIRVTKEYVYEVAKLVERLDKHKTDLFLEDQDLYLFHSQLKEFIIQQKERINNE